MSLPVSYMDQQKIDIELTKLRDHIMKGEDVTEESELPYKHKQGLSSQQKIAILFSTFLLHVSEEN